MYCLFVKQEELTLELQDFMLVLQKEWMPLRKLWPAADAQESSCTKCYLWLKPHRLSFHFPETAPLLLPSCIKTPYFGFLRKDGSERSCSPVLFLWPNWINLSLTPNTSVSGFGLAADQAHKPVFWEVVSNNSIYRKKFEYEGTPAVQTSVVQG